MVQHSTKGVKYTKEKKRGEGCSVKKKIGHMNA